MINRVTLIGYMGADPEIRTFEDGLKMARLRIATSERVYIRKSNEWRDHTEWHTVIFWDSIANYIDKTITKGCQVYVEGALRTREIKDKEGNTSLRTEIAGKEFRLLTQAKSQNPTPEKKNAPQIVPPKSEVDDIPF